MLGPKENVDYDAIDLKSLLFNAGIARSAHRDALLEIYNRISREIVTTDRLTTVDLLHVAFLVKQRSLRGFPAERSIRNACIDVYVKLRSTRDPLFREHLISIIEESIERHITPDEEITAIDLDAATWSVKNLQDNSIFTVIRQQGLLLNATIKMHETHLRSDPENVGRSDTTTQLLNDFCDVKEDEECVLDVDVVDVLPHFLLNFYEQSSLDDARFRMEWISKMLRQNNEFAELERRNALMVEEIASFRFQSASISNSLPWDLRQLVGKTINKHDSVCNDANKLALLLYARSMILESDATPTEAEMLEKKNMISVRQYSNIIHHGKYIRLH